MLRERASSATVRGRSERTFVPGCYGDELARDRRVPDTQPRRGVAPASRRRSRGGDRRGTAPARLNPKGRRRVRTERVRMGRPLDVTSTMKPKKLLAVCGACAVTGAPAAAALAAGGPAPPPPHSRRTARSSRRWPSARPSTRSCAWRGARLAWITATCAPGTCAACRRGRRRACVASAVRCAPTSASCGGPAAPPTCRCRPSCSRSPRASRAATRAPSAAAASFRGKYQFDYGTWARVGGSGDPAAAPEAEQDRRAAMLYARAGSSPWPVCGR